MTQFTASVTGETDLSVLLRSMRPVLREGEFVYCTGEQFAFNSIQEAIFMFKEQEAITLIVPKTYADAHQFAYSSVFAWITLTVHSSLEAVGLTAAFAKILAEQAISCNVVAAYYHDHIFVPVADAHRAIAALQNLSQ